MHIGCGEEPDFYPAEITDKRAKKKTHESDKKVINR